MHIIIDLGANDGCSIKKFQSILQQKNITDYKIYSFEPHPYFYRHLQKYESDHVTIIPKLAFTENGVHKLYFSTIGNDGSSIYSDKTTNGVSESHYVECEAIDLAEFIQSLPSYHTLWLKMDVEGAEYDLIPHLFHNGLLPKVNTLFIEWHHEKISSITKEQHLETIDMVKHIDTQIWDALDFREMTDQHYRDTFIYGDGGT